MLNVAIRSDWILIDQSTLTWVTFKCIIAVIAYKVVKYCISNRTLTRELFASLGENWSFRLFCSRTLNTKTDSVVMWYGTGKHRFYLYDCTQLLNRKATSSSVNSVSWLIDMSFLENVSLERMTSTNCQPKSAGFHAVFTPVSLRPLHLLSSRTRETWLTREIPQSPGSLSAEQNMSLIWLLSHVHNRITDSWNLKLSSIV